jgi:predicted ABC-type sugar transport system permease subunit
MVEYLRILALRSVRKTSYMLNQTMLGGAMRSVGVNAECASRGVSLGGQIHKLGESSMEHLHATSSKPRPFYELAGAQ